MEAKERGRMWKKKKASDDIDIIACLGNTHSFDE
jgi:hypothetical protein